MEISTCEEYVLAELAAAQARIEFLEEKVASATRMASRLASMLAEYDPNWKEKVFTKITEGS